MANVEIMPEIIQGTRMIQNTAKDLAPVDTGILKGSIMVKSDRASQTGIVYTTTEYAAYQEFGTSKMRAQPFLIPAFNQHINAIKKLIAEALRKQLNDKAN